MKIRKVIIVGLFAFAGGMLRYLVNSSWGLVGILGCNLIGAFLLALLTYAVIERNLVADWLSLGLGTGLIGALTTFSTFAVTTIQLWQARPLQAGLYFIVSGLGGLLAAGLGAWLARYLRRP
ncbi:fluoride efflux transporter FluC [Limosilactobacillus antri]|uniref:fluoride efflux transporter FluC n=1 Tax=Limosilactobacillus antri TaxID=227943 RepID=UPI001F571134|nr:CrcB family protein [Limosilactobacillus antri]